MIVVHYLPVYWGIETQPQDRSLITRSTLHEILPPFRQSVWAIRIRVSHRHWLHVGKYRYDAVAGRWGLNTHIDEISQWRGPSNGVGDEETAGDTSTDEVRALE